MVDQSAECSSASWKSIALPWHRCSVPNSPRLFVDCHCTCVRVCACAVCTCEREGESERASELCVHREMNYRQWNELFSTAFGGGMESCAPSRFCELSLCGKHNTGSSSRPRLCILFQATLTTCWNIWFAVTWLWWNSEGGSEVKGLSSSRLWEGLKGSMCYFHTRIKTESRCLKHSSQPGRLATLRTHSVTWHCSHSVNGPCPLRGGRRGRACTCLFWSTWDTRVRHFTKSCR